MSEPLGKKLRFGIIGLGHIAEKAYLKAIGNVKYSELGAICDIEKNRLANWQDKLGVPAYLDFEDMLEK